MTETAGAGLTATAGAVMTATAGAVMTATAGADMTATAGAGAGPTAAAGWAGGSAMATRMAVSAGGPRNCRVAAPMKISSSVVTQNIASRRQPRFPGRSSPDSAIASP